MKLRREFKIGIFAIVVLGVSWWGIKWLGGQNLLLQSNIYYAYFDNVSGLLESSRVKLRGVEVGNVRDITLEGDRVKVEIAVEKEYMDMIPENSIAELGSAGLMGGMEVSIIQGDAAAVAKHGATLEGRLKPDMLGALVDKGTGLMDGLSETVDGVNTLLSTNSQNINDLVANLESMSASIDAILTASKPDINSAMDDLSAFTSTLAANTERMESIIAGLDTFTGELADADVVNKLVTTVESLNEVLAAIESGEGSVGKLVADPELYNSLTTASDNLGLLLEDLKTNPKRYVHFSLFGRSEAKDKRACAAKEDNE